MIQRPKTVFKHPRFYAIFALMTLGFVLVLLRLVYLQGFQHKEWRARAQQAQEKSIELEAERGTIYDRKGRVLALNTERPSVYAIPAEIKEPVPVSRRLASILGIPQQEILQKLRKGGQFAWLHRKISPEKMTEIQKENIKGIGFIAESKRVYPKGSLFGHLLGFAGLDNQGLEGIERKFNATLQGKNGGLILERDAYGHSIFPKGFNYVRPSPGSDLTLTVDEVIQYISERELDAIVRKTGAEGGTVIIMDPWSGEILSMAVRPEFDPNWVKTSRPAQWRNRAITDFYEPGSTFKIVTAAAALEENLIGLDDLVDCEEGTYPVKGTVIHDHNAIGTVSFRQVIAKSSNIGTIKVAEVLGPERLSDYVRAFGFGERLGVDLVGESPGMVRPRKEWSGRSLASIAIGQEIGVTPLQMVAAASVIANGGWLMTPRIVKETRDDPGDRQKAPLIRRRVISEETSELMAQVLKGVVSEYGTARLAAIPGYAVAGKTGTAQKIDTTTGRYSRDKFVSSFVGFVPAENPVLAILVMVDEPKGIAWGGEIAAPVFSRIAQDVLHYMKMPPQRDAPSPKFPERNFDIDKGNVKRVAEIEREGKEMTRAMVLIGPRP